MISKHVTVSFSEDKSSETAIWLFRIMERIVLDQLDIDPTLKGELLFSNRQQITRFIKEFDEIDNKN